MFRLGLEVGNYAGQWKGIMKTCVAPTKRARAGYRAATFAMLASKRWFPGSPPRPTRRSNQSHKSEVEVSMLPKRSHSKE